HLRADLSEHPGIALARHRDADDLAAGFFEPMDFFERGDDVFGLGRAHRLHGNRRIAADRHASDHDLPAFSPRGHVQFTTTLIDGGGLSSPRSGLDESLIVTVKSAGFGLPWNLHSLKRTGPVNPLTATNAARSSLSPVM